MARTTLARVGTLFFFHLSNVVNLKPPPDYRQYNSRRDVGFLPGFQHDPTAISSRYIIGLSGVAQQRVPQEEALSSVKSSDGVMEVWNLFGKVAEEVASSTLLKRRLTGRGMIAAQDKVPEAARGCVSWDRQGGIKGGCERCPAFASLQHILLSFVLGGKGGW